MKNFLIILKDSEEENVSFAKKLIETISIKGGKASYVVEPPKTSSDMIDVPEGTECILTVGGDGALIRASKRTFGSNVPLLGINKGHLGYLCDLDEESAFSAIDELFSGHFDVEERMLIKGRKSGCQEEKTALNDIVISSDNTSQIITLTVYVNGTRLYTFNGDGIIFATPTGSTAYNLSANGPIVDPKTELIVMTPINPHTLISRSIVLSENDEFAIELNPRRRHTIETALVSFDGQSPIELFPNEKFYVKKADTKTKMVRLDKTNFLERIGNKLRNV